MFILFIKTAAIYLILLLIMRFLGKRQLGELEVSELITTILLSELAAIPLTDADASVSDALVPIATIAALEFFISFLTSRHSFLKNLFSDPPSTLIKDGTINQKELMKNRISPDELLSELRQRGVCEPADIKYAILEQNGLLSIIPKADLQQPTLRHLGIETKESGVLHVLISQGVWNEHNLKSLGKSRELLENLLKSKQVQAHDVFLMTVNDANDINVIMKEKL